MSSAGCPGTPTPNTFLYRRGEREKHEELKGAIRDAEVWNCVTLVASERLVPGKQAQRWLERPDNVGRFA